MKIKTEQCWAVIVSKEPNTQWTFAAFLGGYAQPAIFFKQEAAMHYAKCLPSKNYAVVPVSITFEQPNLKTRKPK